MIITRSRTSSFTALWPPVPLAHSSVACGSHLQWNSANPPRETWCTFLLTSRKLAKVALPGLTLVLWALGKDVFFDWFMQGFNLPKNNIIWGPKEWIIEAQKRLCSRGFDGISPVWKCWKNSPRHRFVGLHGNKKWNQQTWPNHTTF